MDMILNFMCVNNYGKNWLTIDCKKYPSIKGLKCKAKRGKVIAKITQIVEWNY